MPTYEEFRAMLPVWKHRLDDELELQPQVMEEISTEVTIRNSRALEAKDLLARTEARLTEDLREDDPKLTVNALAARLAREPERIKAWQDYQRARSDYEKWVGLLEAWRNKGYSIKTLADLYAAQYFSLNSTHNQPQALTRPRIDTPEGQERARSAMRVALRRPTSDPVVDPPPRPRTTSTRRSIIDG